MANCLIAVAGALGGHPCCQGRVQQLHAEADRQVAELVQAEAASRLSQWGLVEIVERIRYALWVRPPLKSRAAGGHVLTWPLPQAELTVFIFELICFA